MEAFKTLLWPFHAGLTTKEHDELERAAALAAAGREVPSALLHSVPSRTFQCNGAEFVRMRSLARCDRPTSVCCLPVLNPLGWVYRSWQALANCTDLTYTAFIVALSIAFNDPSGFTSGGWLDYADMLGSIVYIIDIILGFHVGIVAHWDTRAVVVCGGRAVASFYVRRGTFCLDLIASLPALAQLAVRLTEKRSQPLRLLYLIRLLRLVRVVRLLKYITPGGGSGISMPAMAAVTTRTLLLFNALFSLAVLVNLMGCIWWVVAINGGLEDSWAAAVSAAKNIDLVNGSDVDRWITSIYFALTTVTTIGYGDVTPMTITEIGVTIVFEIIGVAFFGYIINTATAILAASGPSARRAQAIRGKLEDTEEVMRAMEVPNFLKRKIRAYYSEQWAPPVEGPRDARFQLYLELPPRLRTRLVQEKQERPLKQLGFLPDGLTPRERKQVLHILATASVPVRLVAGQRLEEAVPEVPANSPDLDLHGPCIHILDEGEMRALRPGAHFDPSGCIGGRVDFSGPAVIGLTVLFSPDVAPSTAGGGGGADRHKSGSKRQMAAAAAAAVAAAGTNSGDMHRHRRHNGSSSSSGASSSSSGSSSGDSSGDDGSSVRADRRLSHNWQRSVVALSECHLWRINCPQLSTQLRTKQPRVLLHLLDKLLLSLGIDAAAESGGSWVSADTCTDEAQAPGPLASPAQQQQPKLRQQATFRTGTASRLLRLRADLLAEVAAAKESLGGGVEGGLGEAPPGASGRSVATAAWWGRPSLELSQVSVEPGAGASRGHSAGGGGSINAGSVRAEV